PAPPLFLLSIHAPGGRRRPLRSRCRRRALRRLEEADVVKAATAALGEEADASLLRQAARIADGNVARAIALSGGPQLALREKIVELLDRLPASDPRALHALADSIERGDDDLFEIFIETAQNWLSSRLDRTSAPARLARVAEAWQRLAPAPRATQTFHLPPHPPAFSPFT